MIISGRRLVDSPFRPCCEISELARDFLSVCGLHAAPRKPLGMKVGVTRRGVLAGTEYMVVLVEKRWVGVGPKGEKS